MEFRQRAEAIVEAFEKMREDLDQERRAAERQWAKRAKQIESVTFNIAGMYGDLQGLLPGLPPIARLAFPSDSKSTYVAVDASSALSEPMSSERTCAISATDSSSSQSN